MLFTYRFSSTYSFKEYITEKHAKNKFIEKQSKAFFIRILIYTLYTFVLVIV